jgi:hypothetical protein
MPTECFLAVRSDRFGNPNDLVFSPAIETAKGSLSFSHDVCYNFFPRTQQILRRWILANDLTIAWSHR